MALQTVVADVLWNFDVISSVDSHQTLLLDGDRLQFDTRYAQWLRRPISGDSRKQILVVLERTFARCDEVLHSYQCNTYIGSATSGLLQEQRMIVTNISDTLHSILKRQEPVIKGLKTLGTFERYSVDSAFSIGVTRFVEHMQRICRWCETLLGTISGKSENKQDDE